MKVAIRVDASNRIGLGHLARCRTLAEGLRERVAGVHFVCRAHPGHQTDALRAEGYPVSALPAPPAQHMADGDYAAWLGVPQSRDAAETLAALAAAPAAAGDGAAQAGRLGPDCLPTDCLVVDHYGLDADWERALRPHVGRILAIDDLANRRHDCDLLLDQNYAENAAERYRGLVPAGTQLLLGPQHALLHPEYARARQGLAERDGRVRRVLVFFGGTDPQNLSGRALAALSDATLSHLAVDLVVGANNPHADSLAAQAAARAQTRLHGPRRHLADLMAAADVGIGAGGATTWERCCLGLPSLVVSVAENQRPSCSVLAAAGVIAYLGHWDQVTVATLRQALASLTAEPTSLQALSSAGLALVDGHGARRVVAALLGQAPP
jgi:UDP-2,4-diacetamido-2,4,6-trideoxy-beta-L-altropyranose hydrolase